MLFIASSAVSVTLLYITSMYCFISADTCETHCQFVAKPVCFIRGDFSRSERLPQVICEHIILTPFPACAKNIGSFIQHEFYRSSTRITFGRGNQFLFLSFVRVLNIPDHSF